MKPERDYKQGDEETLIKFAWFPVRIGDYRIWLEKYRHIRTLCWREHRHVGRGEFLMDIGPGLKWVPTRNELMEVT